MISLSWRAVGTVGGSTAKEHRQVCFKPGFPPSTRNLAADGPRPRPGRNIGVDAGRREARWLAPLACPPGGAMASQAASRGDPAMPSGGC